MNIYNFKNNEIKKVVCSLLNKNDNENIYLEEIERIERLSINPRIFDKPVVEVDISDLHVFTNLKFLYIRDMIITDREIEVINLLQSLNYIQMNSCNFYRLKNSLYLENLNSISLIGCSNIDMRVLQYLTKLKSLKIISSNVKSYKGLENMQSLEDVCLQNMKELDLSRLMKLR